MISKVTKVTIDNIKAIQHLEFAPGVLTIIRGRNGAGKSSVLDALGAVFSGGHDPGLVRKGAKRGVVEIVTDKGAVITKVITPKRSTLEVLDENGEPVPSPQSYVNELCDKLAVDAGRLLNPAVKAKDLAKEILQIIDIEVTDDELIAATGDPDIPRVIPPTCSTGWDAITAVWKNVYDRRRRANVANEENTAAIFELEKNLPPAGEDVRADLAKAKAVLAEVDELTNAEYKRVDDEAFAEDVRITEHYDLQIEALRKEKAEKLKAAAAARVEAGKAVLAQSQPARDEARETIARLEEVQRHADKAKGVRETLEKMRQSGLVKAAEAEALDKAVKGVEELKLRKLQSLNVNGLTYDGEVFLVDGIPMDHSNTARRTKVWFDLVRAKGSGMAAIEDAEHLDNERMAEIKAMAVAEGMQVIAAVMDPDAEGLTVETA